MAYPGGKSGAGIYQRIVNLMPPHDIYIEPFLGGAAVMRMKRPARLNIGLDLDAAALDRASLELARGSGSGSGNAGNDDGDRRVSSKTAILAGTAAIGRNGGASWGWPPPPEMAIPPAESPFPAILQPPNGNSCQATESST